MLIVLMIFHMAIMIALACWLVLVLLPDRAYRYDESFTIAADDPARKKQELLPFVNVLIPARNEAAQLPATLPFIIAQDYPAMQVTVIDDNSTDMTQEIAENIKNSAPQGERLQIIAGEPLPEGWAGKLWALHQGVAISSSDWLLFTDADIYYPPGMLASLVKYALSQKLAMISLMARLRTDSFWERLLLPAFLYFFKLLYPFRAVRDRARRTAAAAGGCILIHRSALTAIGGLRTLRQALIDDVALARAVKAKGLPIALMVAPQLLSKRGYDHLSGIWQMIARSAFTELRYSYLRLAACIVAMITLFLLPLLAIASPLLLYGSCHCSPWPAMICGLLTYGLMSYSYAPSIRYFHLPGIFSFTLPIIAMLYLAMTTDSALKYTFGTGAEWKGRQYRVESIQ